MRLIDQLTLFRLKCTSHLCARAVINTQLTINEKILGPFHSFKLFEYYVVTDVKDANTIFSGNSILDPMGAMSGR